MTTCSACGVEVDGPACGACGSLQPVQTREPFSVLGLPRRMRLERKALEHAFRERSRLVHPDRHSKASEDQKLLSLKHTNLVNEAYALLKHPRKRATHLLELAGRPMDPNGARTQDPALLMELMELRESLDGMDLDGLEAKEQALRNEVTGLLDVAAEHFDDGRHSLDEVASALEKVRYFERLLEIVDERIERES
ncbi:MAG: Fe-S protein assembly co-chaperone HscB [Myxococcota bacterium]